MKADQEPSIEAWANAVRRAASKGIEIVMENSPVGESQSNGAAEQAVDWHAHDLDPGAVAAAVDQRVVEPHRQAAAARVLDHLARAEVQLHRAAQACRVRLGR